MIRRLAMFSRLIPSSQTAAVGVALFFGWRSVLDQSRVFTSDVMKAVSAEDGPGVGDAQFEFDLNTDLTFLVMAAIYAIVHGGLRLVGWFLRSRPS